MKKTFQIIFGVIILCLEIPLLIILIPILSLWFGIQFVWEIARFWLS